MRKNLSRILQVAFVAALGILLVGGLARALFRPQLVNTFENRKANLLPRVRLSSVLSTQFQTDMEAALTDQVPLSGTAKKYYNKLSSSITYSILRNIYKENPNRYYSYNSLLIYGGDMLLFHPRTLDAAAKASLDERADSINSFAARFPDIDFFAYYIEKDTDINFMTGEQLGAFEYLSDAIAPERCTLKAFAIDDFSQYSTYFFKTDHHWSHKGSYTAYTEILEMLRPEAKPLPHGDAFLVGTLSGSKAEIAKSEGVWTEEMYAYQIDFPDMAVTIDAEAADDYGHQNSPCPADAKLSYGYYYGGDDAEVVFDCGKTGGENLLIIGESYDNALLKLLASHYNKTFSVDLRYYEPLMGAAFDFSQYVADNDIDTVLYIGNIDYYVLQDFTVR